MYDGIPIHPLLVHIPLVVGVTAALLAVVLWAAIASHYLHYRAWWIVVALYVGAFGGAFMAVRTGHAEHEKVEDVLVHEQPLHEHEEDGERYELALGIIAALSLLTAVTFTNRKWGMRLAGLTAAGGVVIVWFALVAGHTGGRLVYREGAASYYVNPQSGSTPSMRAGPGDEAMPADSGSTDDDHEDHDHSH